MARAKRSFWKIWFIVEKKEKKELKNEKFYSTSFRNLMLKCPDDDVVVVVVGAIVPVAVPVVVVVPLFLLLPLLLLSTSFLDSLVLSADCR